MVYVTFGDIYWHNVMQAVGQPVSSENMLIPTNVIGRIISVVVTTARLVES